MADQNKKKYIKYENTTYILEDARIPDPSAADNGKVLGVVGGEYALKQEEGGSGGGLTDDVKTALLDCFEHVAWINDQGQTYYDALYAALYPPKTLVSISAAFNQGSAVIYDTDSLDTLKQYLTVTATYDDSSTEIVTNYTLSGTLAEGTSTITVLYNGKTTAFAVNVTAPATVVSISAEFNQGSAVIDDTDDLDTLRQYLTVTATMSDSTTQTVTNYTLSGTLEVGTSTITVSYGGKTTTFNVTVAQASLLPSEYQQVEYIANPSNAYIVTSIPISLGYTVHGKAYLSAKPSQAVNVCGGDNKGATANWVNVSFCCYSAATANYAGTFYGRTNCFDALTDLYSSPLEFTTVHTENNISISLKNSGGEKSKTVSQSNVVAVDALNVFRAASGAPNPFTGRIYLIEVLDTNNQATAKLIPCYRKADGVVGMYDTVNKAFYTSANSTAFTKGGDVA